MPGFLSWIKGFFSTATPPPPADLPETRLLNPVSDDSVQELTGEIAELADELEEQMFCWLLDSEPDKFMAEPSSTESQVLDELNNRLQTGNLDELPRKPFSLPMLMRALSDPKADRQHITEIILGDPALTDQLLQVANSPYFRHGEQSIDSVDQAVFMLGIDGIRNVVAAAIMRPMMAARNSREALFAQRVWRWGLTCARASELIAKSQGADPGTHFMSGLLPALSYITIYRELHRIGRARLNTDPNPALIRQALARHQWSASQLLANVWHLPPTYHALLLAAERPAPEQAKTPLNDGMVLGTREVLRHANQPSLAEEDLPKVVRLEPNQIGAVRATLATMLREGGRSATRV